MASKEEPMVQFVDEKLISNVMKNLYDQRKISRFCDIVFKVCGEEIFAHSNVLAAASPYFASFLGMGQDLPRAFSQKAPQIIEIHIDGASDSNSGYGMAVRKVVDFMYTSVIELSLNVLSQVVEIAKIMQMDRVLEYCERFRQSVQTSGITTVVDSKLPSQEDPQQIKKDPDYQLDNLITNNFVAGESLPPQEIGDSKDQTTQTNIFTHSNSNVLSVSNNCLVLSSTAVTSSASVQPCETINGQPFQVSGSTAETIFEESTPIQDITTDSLMDETLSTLVTHTTTSTNTTSIITTATNINSVSNSENQNLSPTIESDKTEDSVETGKPDTEPEAQIELEEKSLSQCPGAVRSSLRIRLGKKHTRSRSIYRNKGKTRSRLHTSSNNNQNSANNNDSSGGNGKCKKLGKVNNVNFEVYVCDDCLYSTYSFYHFKRHQKIHLEGKYGCDKCDYKANKLKTLTDHNRSHLHAELQCSYCDYKATNAEELTLHLSRHSGEHPYFCCLCDMKFKTKTQLNLHAPKHSEDKPFVCPKCFAGFKWKHALKSHMVVHSNTKDHLCDVCGFATAHKSQLKAHHLIHTGETFKCTVQGCIFQALKRQNLKYHMLTHTHEKPHVCRVCNQSFSLIKNMKRHMLLHSNDRPYKCDHCSFTSTRYDKLKEHLLKQHGIGERPNKKHRISDYQISNNNGLFTESYEEAEENSTKEENTIPPTTTQIVITASDDIPVPFAITRVNSDGFTEISYPTIQYV
ncbi:zinc finger protein 184 [Octopus bimaculoides]|uniref:BTB domain-containing protein n=1 Tax=Octopus bimaculoides TaxID=37653 RepID=A0A0L8I1K6_OCTBM|nr:zinc finger protein 184 [Octopus bimaculoides]|eukprot:XP_014767586.1 PREDICTED: zinc finger protein 468-like [Octopus bimaculoides]